MTERPLRILVDGRVFSTVAHDRGMGLYVRHILSLLAGSGHKVSVLLFRNCHLGRDDTVFSRYSIHFVDRDPNISQDDAVARSRGCHQFTALLSELIDTDGYDIYVDATPFLGPERLDLFTCPVIAICYDLIPLRYPDFYLRTEPQRAAYYNGLARLYKADSVVCISQTTCDEAARYLSVPESPPVSHLSRFGSSLPGGLQNRSASCNRSAIRILHPRLAQVEEPGRFSCAL